MIAHAQIKSNKTASVKTATTIFKTLSAYPVIWTAGILFGGLIKSLSFVQFILLTWVLTFYLGTFTWLGLVIYLADIKKSL